MNLNDLLILEGVDPKQVLVLRHRPTERGLYRVLPWLAGERPEVYNAYQQTQGPKLEGAMSKLIGTGFVASFIGHEPGRALFVGLYEIQGTRPLNFDEFWRVPAYQELKTYGMNGWTEKEERDRILWFDLGLTDFYRHWSGRLEVAWPPPERSWYRRAHRNDFQVLVVREQSALDAEMPDWREICFTWKELGAIPSRWKAALREWRAIYYIYDMADGAGYVGAAYGSTNLLGRWLDYAARGHGGNRLLRSRSPESLRFSILERVSPDMDPADVIRLEATWKERLHTRSPQGLNDN